MLKKNMSAGLFSVQKYVLDLERSHFNTACRDLNTINKNSTAESKLTEIMKRGSYNIAYA